MRAAKSRKPEAGWRCQAAAILEEVLVEENGGSMPTTPCELIEMLERQGFTIVAIDPAISRDAVSLVDRRVILLPAGSDEEMTRALVHEAGEIYLRMPLRPEYVYPTSVDDEYHKVASLTASRTRQTSPPSDTHALH